MPTSGEVRINGAQIFGHNEKPPEMLKCQPPVIYQPREVGGATKPVVRASHKHPTGKRLTNHSKPGTPNAPTVGKTGTAQERAKLAHYWATHPAAYNKWAHEHGKDHTDCGVFIGKVMRDSGSDPNYPAGSTGRQWDYVHKNGWTIGKIDEDGGPQPGDVLLRYPYERASGNVYGHTGLYVGPDLANKGHDVTDEASLGSHGHGPRESSKYTDSSLAHTYQIWARPPGGK